VTSKKWQKYSVTIESIQGTHQKPSNKSTKIEVLAFSVFKQPNVNFLPSNLDKFFPNLKIINGSHANLKGIFKNHLKGLKTLKILNLSANQIQGVKSGTFHENSQLERIYLDNNHITQVDATAFDGLNNLKRLHMTGNRCNSKFIDADNVNDVAAIVDEIRDGKCRLELVQKVRNEGDEMVQVVVSNDREIKELNEKIEKLEELLTFEVIALVVAIVIFMIILMRTIRTCKNSCEMAQPIIESEKEREDEVIYDVPAVVQPMPARRMTKDNSDYNEAALRKFVDEIKKFKPIPKVRSQPSLDDIGKSEEDESQQGSSRVTRETINFFGTEPSDQYVCRLRSWKLNDLEETETTARTLNPFLAELEERQRKKGIRVERRKSEEIE
jgi:hypothetical protein